MIIVIDTKEQRPFDLAWSGYEVRRGNLTTGDYSLLGHENNEGAEGVGITIERKSLIDLYGTLGQGRDRFRREFERMQRFHRAFVVVEAGYHEIASCPPSRSKMKPKQITQTIWSWSIRYGIPFLAFPNKQFAARATVRLLEQYYRHFGRG